MEEGNAEPRGGLGDMTRPVAVDPKGESLLRLRLVDGGIGGGVDDDVRARRFEPGEDGGAVGQVERRPAERDHLELRSRTLDERRRHLALGSGDRDLHSNRSGASLSRGHWRSLSDRTGPPDSDGQAIPIAGSSQATPRSWAAE